MMYAQNYRQDSQMCSHVEKIQVLYAQALDNVCLPLARTAVCRHLDYIDIEIPRTYDKKYYVAEEYTRTIGKHDFSSDIHLVRFSLNELEEISTLLHCLGDKIGYSVPLNDMKYPEVVDFLNHNHTAYLLASALMAFLEAYGNGPSAYYAQPIVDAREFVNQYRKKKNKEIDLMYSALLQNGKIPIRWKSEYRLYATVKKLYPDAVFQYAPDWLKRQKIDIYIPSLRIAIEYQGKQHYEPVEFFGG